MWLSQVFRKLCDFVTAYIKNFRYSDFDLHGRSSMSRLQLGRFYWVNLIISAFVLYYLFNSTQQLREAHPLEHAKCVPEQSISTFAFLILAEAASFVLLLGAQAEALMLYRFNKGKVDHAILTGIPTRAEAARRLHRLLWTWFPLILGFAVYLSMGAFDRVAQWCNSLPDEQYSGSAHGARLILALVFPGLLVSFLGVAGLNWALFRWQPNRRLATTLAFAFTFYVLTMLIVGPSDIFGLIKLCRQIQEGVESLFKLLIGG